MRAPSRRQATLAIYNFHCFFIGSVVLFENRFIRFQNVQIWAFQIVRGTSIDFNNFAFLKLKKASLDF